eukprot:359750-Chlamydomonas_euryale.AAC.3
MKNSKLPHLHPPPFHEVLQPATTAPLSLPLGTPTCHNCTPTVLGSSWGTHGRVAQYVCTSKYVQYVRTVRTYVGVAKYAYLVR